MPVCGQPTWSDCAHQASKQLLSLGILDLRNKPGLYGCQTCKHPLRAHEVGKYCQKYPTVNKCQQVGTYLIYQVRDKDNQGHVYVYHNGKHYGNGLYNWQQVNQKGGKISRKIFKIK